MEVKSVVAVVGGGGGGSHNEPVKVLAISGGGDSLGLGCWKTSGHDCVGGNSGEAWGYGDDGSCDGGGGGSDGVMMNW